MTRWYRRRRTRHLGGAVVVVILVAAGLVATDHIRSVDRVRAAERAKAKSFSLSRTRDAITVPTPRSSTGTGSTTTRTSTTPGTPATATSSTTDPATPAPLTFPRPTSTTDYDRRTVTFQYGGLNRDFLVFRPHVVTVKTLPVVMHLSGSAIPAAGEAQRANYLQVAQQAIIVYPDDSDIDGQRNWDSGQCCGAASSDKVDDVGFLEEVIRLVRSERDASQGPVYLSGYSNGGKMALLMACDDPREFAAVAVYGAVPTFACPDQQPISMLEMAGTADTDVTIGPGGAPVVQGGFTEPRVTTVVEDELRVDGCTAASEEGRAGPLDELLWSTCAGGRRVGLAIWTGETHAWPQVTSTTPSAQQLMWGFFESLGAGR